MDKNALETFIGKYHLGGICNQVTWKSTADGLTTAFASDDKNLAGFLTTKKVDLPVGEYSIYYTQQLKSLLSVLGDEIAIKVEVDKKGAPLAFVMSDDDTKVRFVLADPGAIPKSPSKSVFPDFEVSAPFDKKFVQTYSKAANAVRESETFAVIGGDGDVKIVLGHSDSINQNSITIQLETSVSETLPTRHYFAKYLKDIFSANREVEEGVLHFSSAGLVHVELKNDDYNVEYYLPGVES